MSRQPSKTPTDWELVLLKVLWTRGLQTVDQIREALRAEGFKRSDSAVRTILRIMIKKEFVDTEVIDKVTHFRAAIDRKDVESQVLQHVIDTLFDQNQEQFVKRALEEAENKEHSIEKSNEHEHVHEQMHDIYKDKTEL